MEKLFEFIYNQQATAPLERCMSVRNEAGQWESYSTDQVVDYAEKLASGLLSKGYKPGDKIAIVAYKNRPEWVITDLALQMCGMISVPLYPTISSKEYEFVLNKAEVKAALCGGADLYDKLASAKANVSSLQDIICYEKDGQGEYWKNIFSTENKAEVEKIKAAVKPDDLMTIIFTSGTTGNPKGVMLTHTNIVHVVTATLAYLKLPKKVKTLSFLPLCHIYERAISQGYIYNCNEVYFTTPDKLGGPDGELQAVKPVFFTTVPRLLEKVYEAIYNKGLDLTGIKKKLFFWALGLTDKYKVGQNLSGLSKFKWNIADKLIFSKWREALGGNIQLISTGAAPCPVKIMQVFCAAGIPIREGYGLTETSPTLTLNGLDEENVCLGTVGFVIPGVDLKIDDSDGEYREHEGEILAIGPSVTQGYYENPEANEKAYKMIDGVNWFRTGDIGKMVDGPGNKQYLKITDRKKELLKTSGGKYVAPAPIENRIKESFLVEQMMVVGDKQKFVSALIVPAPEALKNWFEEECLEWNGLANACCDQKVIDHYESIIKEYNKEFSHIEQIKKFTLLDVEWLAVREDNTKPELTPTMKLKRRVIREKFAKEIADIYA